jgi:hypothetical protein
LLIHRKLAARLPKEPVDIRIPLDSVPRLGAAGGPLDNGRLRYREDIVDGLQNYPGTIAGLYRGEISQVVRDED